MRARGTRLTTRRSQPLLPATAFRALGRKPAGVAAQVHQPLRQFDQTGYGAQRAPAGNIAAPILTTIKMQRFSDPPVHLRGRPLVRQTPQESSFRQIGPQMHFRHLGAHAIAVRPFRDAVMLSMDRLAPISRFAIKATRGVCLCQFSNTSQRRRRGNRLRRGGGPCRPSASAVLRRPHQTFT